MKKLLSTLLCITILCFSNFIFADTTKESLITSPQLLIERAEKGVSDISLEQLPNFNTTVTLKNEKGAEIPMKILKTAQVIELNNSKLFTRNTKQDIAVTVVAVVDESAYQSRSSSGTITESDWDATKGVKAYCTIYYTQNSSADDRYLLTKVTGGWNVEDSSIRISNREVDYACKGWAPGGYNNSQEGEISSPGLTFSKNTGFSTYVTDDIIACNTRCTLKRGTSSTWSLSITNQK
ncbi:MAG: hypothetical protein JXR88_03675 [Clostridia bacterium]|nr:hypothetical protein [Clostridia bacterium]